MTTKIIVKNLDQSIVILVPNPKRYSVDELEISSGKKLHVEKCRGLKKYKDQGLEWFITDDLIDKSDLETREQLYHDGDSIKKDLSWEVMLMPDHVVKNRSIKDLEEKIDTELSKPTPQELEVFRLNREISKLKEKKVNFYGHSLEWLSKAMEGLDQRVYDGKADKTLIRQKLLAKMEELKNPKPVVVPQVKASPKVIESNIEAEIKAAMDKPVDSGVDPQMEPENSELASGAFSKFYKEP